MSAPKRGFYFGTLFLAMHCEKNQGRTRNLVLKGNHLIETIGRRVTDEDVVRITAFLRENEDIVSLELPYNEITSCGMATLIDFFLNFQTLKHMNLVGNNINFRGLQYLAEMEENCNLYSLRLSGNKVGDEGGRLISTLLREKIPLKYLDMSDTHMTLSGIAHILATLLPSRGGQGALEYLDLGRPLPQAFHDVNDGHVAEFISQVLSENRTLKEIHLQQYRFDFRDVEIMLPGLLANNTLICLDLNNNNIGDDGVKYLCTYLETSPQLECLMIGANNFGDLGATSLSRSLPFSKIKLLDVTNNHITDDGMMNVLYTIKKTEMIKALFMWGNTLTHESLVILQLLFETGILDPEHSDIRPFFSDNKLHASWNYEANRYTERFYCVADFTNLSNANLVLNRFPPAEKPDIYYKYHVDNKDIGFPMCEWDKKFTKNFEYFEI